MIPRYTRPEMARLWSDEARYARWLQVELLAMEAWAELGVVPREAVEAVRRRARVDAARIAELERVVHHDVVAFTSSIAEQVGPEARWFHYGLTSSDVVDTAQALALREACGLLEAGVRRLAEALAEQARRWRRLPAVGRTHGVHAEPMAFGLKFAYAYAEQQRNLERLRRARDAVSVGKIAGAVGTYAHVDPFVEEYVCRRLGLTPEPVATQVVPRDRHAELLAALAVIGGTLERLAVEIRHLQRTEVREAEEPFRPGQKGSSAMPHKRNPEKCERVAGLARLLRAYAHAALEDQALWHERDISHSSVERVVLPGATALLDYMLHLMAEIVAGLHVYPDAVAANLGRTGGLIFSQQVLLRLVERGMPREEAYALVQELAMAAWQGGPSFAERVRADPRVRALLAPGEVAACFEVEPYLRHVDRIYARLGLDRAPGAEGGGAGA